LDNIEQILGTRAHKCENNSTALIGQKKHSLIQEFDQGSVVT